MQGGIVWRIAMEVLAHHAVDLVMAGPSDEVKTHGKPFYQDGGPPYFDDCLTDFEEEFICGMYSVPTESRTYDAMTINYNRLNTSQEINSKTSHGFH